MFHKNIETAQVTNKFRTEEKNISPVQPKQTNTKK